MPTTHRVAVLAAPETFVIREMQLGLPGEGEVRLRIEGCGVCPSNVPPFRGREWFEYPFEPGAPGREAWGVVEAVGSGVRGIREGQRVASLSQYSYATHEIVDHRELVKLPDELADLPFPGRPLGGAMNIFARSDVRAGQTVAIVGVGFMGSLLTALCSSIGAEVIAISRREASRNMGERFGARHKVELGTPREVVEAVRAITGDALCDRVIECAGRQASLDVASEIVGMRKTLVIAGYHQEGPRRVNMQSWNWRGIDVVNAHERDPEVDREGVRAAVSAVIEKRIDPRPLFTHRFALDELEAALYATKNREDGFMKALLIND